MSSLYTIVVKEPSFVAHIELPNFNNALEEILSASWFKEAIIPYLEINQNELDGIIFQMEQLEGLINTWAGFWGKSGKYSYFTLVKTDDSEVVRSGAKFEQFTP